MRGEKENVDKGSLLVTSILPRDEAKIVNGAFSIGYGYYVRDEAPAISLPLASRINRPVLLGNVSRHRSREHSLLSFRYNNVPCNIPFFFLPLSSLFIGKPFFTRLISDISHRVSALLYVWPSIRIIFLLLNGFNFSRWTFSPTDLGTMRIFFVDLFYFFDAIIKKGLIMPLVFSLFLSLREKLKRSTIYEWTFSQWIEIYNNLTIFRNSSIRKGKIETISFLIFHPRMHTQMHSLIQLV